MMIRIIFLKCNWRFVPQYAWRWVVDEATSRNLQPTGSMFIGSYSSYSE